MSNSSDRLANSYFFYGTHPIRVPHSNSLDAVPTHPNDFALPTTHSLQSYVDLPSKADSDDDESEVKTTSNDSFRLLNVEVQIFEDASETLHSDVSPKASNDPALVDWNQAFLECDEINKLFFENRVHEALQRATAQ